MSETAPGQVPDEAILEDAPIVDEAAAEKEKKELSLDEQAEVYSEILGVDKEEILKKAQAVLAEMTEEQKQELRMVFYVPAGNAADAARATGRVRPTYNPESDNRLERIVTEGERGQVLVGFARYDQQPDPGTYAKNGRGIGGDICKSPREWEEIGDTFMSPRAYIMADAFYRRAHGEGLGVYEKDERYDGGGHAITMCPGSRMTADPKFPEEIPAFYDGGKQTWYLTGMWEDKDGASNVGVRRVVEKEFES